MRKFVWLLVGVLMSFAMADADARGMLGQRLGLIGGGVTFVGDEDIKEYDDTSSYYGASVVVPVHKYVDLGIGANYGELEGTDDRGVTLDYEGKGVFGGTIVHFRPDSGMDPYVSAVVHYTEAESTAKKGSKSNSDDDENTSGDIGAGVEFDLGHDFSFSPSASYNNIGGDGGEYWEVTVSLDKWLNKYIGIDINASYDFDDEDVSVGGALLVGF